MVIWCIINLSFWWALIILLLLLLLLILEELLLVKLGHGVSAVHVWVVLWSLILRHVWHWWLVLVLGLLHRWLFLMAHSYYLRYFSSCFWLVYRRQWEWGSLHLKIYWWSYIRWLLGTLLNPVEFGWSKSSKLIASWWVHHPLGVFVLTHFASWIVILSYRHWHIFRGCIVRIVFVFAIAVDLMSIRLIHHGFIHLLLEELEIGVLSVERFLHLLDVLTDQVEVDLLIFPVLLEIGSRLNISQNEVWNLLQIEVFLASEWENLVSFFLMDNNEDIWLALLDHLLCLAKQSSFLDVELFVLNSCFFTWHLCICI